MSPSKNGGFHYDGAIVKIRVENFMAYEKATLMPGPNLNMILGPNGTGKSAMVCCIIIGLAGEVSLTGRGQSPVDFVNKNKDYAVTEIELHNNKGLNYVVERKITITDRSKNKIDHKSEWKINSKPCLKSQVQNLMKELNIKVDNLCQFLPQDSVTQFVKMNTVELLTDTLKAAGDNQLVDDHKTLVTKTKEINEAKVILNNLQQSCEENAVNAQRLQSEVQQLQQRDDLVKKKNICNKKIFYARYMDCKRKLESAKIEGRKLTEQLEAVEQDCEPHKKAKQLYTNEQRKLDITLNKTNSQVQASLNIIRGFQNDIENLKLKCTEENAKFRSREEEESARNSAITLKQQEVESLRSKLAEARDIDCSNQIRSLEEKLHTLKSKIDLIKLTCQKTDDRLHHVGRSLVEARRQRENINAINDRKMQLLRNRYPDAYKVVEWLGRNRELFSGRVYNPLMCEINVKDHRFNSIVEHAISRQDFQAFVCEEREDVTTLSRMARDELKVKINIIMAPDISRDQEFKHQNSQLANISNSCGIKYFLKDLIEAPETIIRYLCASNNFHRIPVGTGCTELQIKQLMEVCPRFYNDSSFFNVSRSRYDNQQMIVRDTVRESQHLKYSLDLEKLQNCNSEISKFIEMQTKLHEERTNQQSDIEKGKQDYQEIRQKLASLKEKQGEKEKFERMIARTLVIIENLKAEKIDINAERNKLRSTISSISIHMVDKLLEISKTCDNFVQIRQNYMKALISKELISLNSQLADERLKVIEQDSKRLREEITRHKNSLRIHENAIEESKNEAEEKIRGFRKGKLDAETKAKFDEIEQEDVETLKSIRNDLAAQIDRIQPDTGDIMSEFKRQNKEFLDKKTKIKELEKTINSVEQVRDQIKVNWRIKLDEVINVIDQNYKDFMMKLNYGGQVKLDFRPEDPNDFGAYGISIMVRYRDNEDLIPLTSTRQSGGERSVATMIYMLALQTKTTVPFRCVDEINQGMDKENERKVFELLVETADSSSSQYFLVSPKLLTDLNYSEKMRIHIVFNGKRLKQEWDLNVISNDNRADDDDITDEEDENANSFTRNRRRSNTKSIVKKRR